PRREADAVTAALLLAGAVLAWPGNAAVARLRLLHEPGDRPAGLRRWLDGVPVSVLAPAAAGVAALLVAGPPQAGAAPPPARPYAGARPCGEAAWCGAAPGSGRSMTRSPP